MNFLEALKLAVSVIREQRGLDEIYLYETNSQTRVYLKDCEGSLQFMRDEPLPLQIFLAGVVDNRIVKKQLSIEVIFSKNWEVCLRQSQHLKAQKNYSSKIGEPFIDYTPVGKEEVQDV